MSFLGWGVVPVAQADFKLMTLLPDLPIAGVAGIEPTPSISMSEVRSDSLSFSLAIFLFSSFLFCSS